MLISRKILILVSYTIFSPIFYSMVSIVAIKLVLFFTRLFRGGELRAYKIKPVLFHYAVGFLAATKTLHKTNEKLD